MCGLGTRIQWVVPRTVLAGPITWQSLHISFPAENGISFRFILGHIHSRIFICEFCDLV